MSGGVINERTFLQRLKILGFEGPTNGGSHRRMKRGEQVLILPNHHGSKHGNDVPTRLIHRLLLEAGVSKEEWDTSADSKKKSGKETRH